MNISSNISNPAEERTLSSTPGPVQNLTLTLETDPTKPRSIKVTWMPPNNRDENGVILFYKIICYNNATNVSIQSNREEYMAFGREQRSIRFENLTAGIPYFISVSANTSVGFGPPVKMKATIPSGAPLPPKMILTRSTVEVTEPRRQLAINLPISDFFCSFMYGSLHNSGIIVAQSSRTNDDIYRGNSSYYFSTVIKNYRSWSDVHDSDNIPPYRATSDDWKPPVECGMYCQS
ncbi:hypothetical protein CHS0354_000128 [Potamilus streckersoni]|uniref:Fibronectin type-III domain-containing protein n=1 Tax=Potamilus streckersoni TaxID=2493646 RepID=A0AAE0VV41_9BIVA|nr:hypothetical protein CHS0354_000128 [Potamilus streckersoni]